MPNTKDLKDMEQAIQNDLQELEKFNRVQLAKIIVKLERDVLGLHKEKSQQQRMLKTLLHGAYLIKPMDKMTMINRVVDLRDRILTGVFFNNEFNS